MAFGLLDCRPGAVLVFIAIVVVYAWAMSRFERQDAQAASAASAEGRTRRSTAVASQARRRRVSFARLAAASPVFHLVRAGVLGFLALMTWAEHQGLSRHWIGPIFLSSPP